MASLPLQLNPNLNLNLNLNGHRPFNLNLKPPSFHFSIRASISKSKPLLLRATCTAIAAAAFFLARGNLALAAAVAPPPAQAQPQEQLEDVEELRAMMEEKLKANELAEAVQLLERLMWAQPEELEWVLVKANVHNLMGDPHLARPLLERILRADPLRVDALHGLAMAASQESEMRDVWQRIQAAMERQTIREELRDLRLLSAQLLVMESKYPDALQLYEQLVREEPRDFRPYLCLGIVHTLLKNEPEAQKQFDVFRRLLPKNHPYREYFDDNMFATNLFSSSSRAT